METFVSVGKLYLFAGVFFAVCVMVIIVIMLDLWDGVHTARKTNQRVHSHKLRVTIEKVSEYWRFVLIGFLVDVLGCLLAFYALPFVTMLFGAGLIVVEAKSMFEHAHRRKSHATELPDIVRSIMQCAHEADAKKIVEMLTAKSDKDAGAD